MARESPKFLDQLRDLQRQADEAWGKQDIESQGKHLREMVTLARAHQGSGDTVASPEVAELLDRASFALYRLSLNEPALEAVDLALGLNPELPSALQHKGVILLAMNREVDQVLGLLDRALSLNPQDKNIWASKGDALKVLGRPEEAVEAYLHAQQLDATSTQFVDRALKLLPGDPRALRSKLAMAMALGGVQQATQVCEQLLQSNPHDPELHFTRAQLLSSQGRYSEALPSLNEALSKRSEEPRFQFLQARILFALGRTTEAIPIYQRLFREKAPAEPAVLSELANTLEAQHQEPALLLEARRRLAEVDPGNVANLQKLLALAQTQGRAEVAAEACRSWLKASPHTLEAERTLGEILRSQGQVEEALKVYQELTEAHPQEGGEVRKALVLAREHRLWSYEATFARALLRLRPKDAEVALWLAQSLSELGQNEAALQIYEQLISAQPDQVTYLLEKKRILNALGRTEEVPALLDRLFELDPGRHDVALERGNLYLSRAYRLPFSDPETKRLAAEALRSYTRSVVSSELRSPSLLGIARSSRLLGDLPRAAQSYRDFLAEPSNSQRGDIFKEFGHTMREARRNAEAHMAYERAVALGREDTDLFFGLVEVLSALNEDARALHYVELLLQREPKNALFLRRRGRLLMRTGQKALGLEILRSSVSPEEKDPRVFFEVGEALKEQGDYPEALDYLKRGLEKSPQDRFGQRALGETFLLAGRYPEAAQIVDTLLRSDANDPRAWKLRRDVYRALHRDNEVIYSLRALLLLDPNDTASAQEKFRLHREHGERAEALETLDQWIPHVGTGEAQAPLWMARGDLLLELGRKDEALGAYDQAVTLSEKLRPEILYRRAELHARNGEAAEALRLLEELSRGPEGGPPRSLTYPQELLRAKVLLALGRSAEARSLLEKLAPEHSDDPEPGLLYLRSLLESGEMEPALDYFQLNEARLQGSPDSYLGAAEAQAGLGSLPKSLEIVERGLSRHPDAAALWKRKAELCVRLERPTEAVQALSQALKSEPKNASLFLELGELKGKLGHPEEELATYEQGLAVAPADKLLLVHRGSVLLTLKRPEPALASFAAALKIDPELEAAVEGQKLAQERIRETQIESLGKDALLLEARLGRPVTKNDLFVTLHVPFDLLEPVTRAISRAPELELSELSPAEMQELEAASYEVIRGAFERKLEILETRGLSLADIALLSPPSSTLESIQRVFGYLEAVLKTEIRPENVTMTPDVEEMARQALALPPDERSLFNLCRTFRVGPYKARLIKVVEEVGGAAHAPLPVLRVPSSGAAPGGRATVPPPPPSAPLAGKESSTSPPLAPAAPPDRGTGLPSGASPAGGGLPSGLTRAPEGSRCESCGGLAQWRHQCGALVCSSCIVQFSRCPRCALPLSLEPSPTSVSTAPPPSGPGPPPAPSTAPPPAELPAEGKRKRRGIFRRSSSDGEDPRL